MNNAEGEKKKTIKKLHQKTNKKLIQKRNQSKPQDQKPDGNLLLKTNI